MIIKFLYSFILLFSIYTFKAQPYFAWADQFDGGNSLGYSITKDASGNIYTTGYFSSGVDLDPGPGTSTIAGSGSYICKLDNNGNLIWAKNCANGNGYAGYVGLDGMGNIIITGGFNGIVDFDPSAATFTLSGGNFFISKLDASGNFIWTKQLTGSSLTLGATTIDNNDNIIFTGFYNGTVDFDPSIVTYTLSALNNTPFVCKFDNSGNFIWAKQMTSSFSNSGFCRGIAADNLANIIFTGWGSPMDMDPGPSTFMAQDDFVTKLDANGNFVWAKSFQFALGGCAIKTDAIGNIYRTGNFGGTVDFDPGPSTFTLSSPGTTTDVYVQKLSNSGNFLWANVIGTTTEDIPKSIAISTSGNVFITGALSSNLISDIFISKVDSIGNIAWVKQFGGTNGDQGNDIMVDASQNIYTTGYFNGTMDCDPTLSSYTLTSFPANTNNAFVLKWSPTAASSGIKTSTNNNNNFSICPNPSDGILNVHISTPLHVTNELQIINVLGQVVYQSSITSQESSIHVQQLNSGIYYLKVLENNKVIYTQKLIKE